MNQPATAPDRDTPFATVMKTWARWMKMDDHQHSQGNAEPQDVKEFMQCAEAVDTMVADLTIHQRWAVKKAYGVTTQWIFPGISFTDAMRDAEDKLTTKFKVNVSTRRYFVES